MRATMRLLEAIDPNVYLKAAETLLRSRKEKVIIDHLSPNNSYLFSKSLEGHIPASCNLAPFWPTSLLDDSKVTNPRETRKMDMPTGHHLVYFPPQLAASQMMPDGTDADHCPGAPFTRRMWAGGSVSFPRTGFAWHHTGRHYRRSRPDALAFDFRTAVCVETVSGDPLIKGPPGKEKVFVEVVRRYGGAYPRSYYGGEPEKGPPFGKSADSSFLLDAVRRAKEEPVIEEVRTLVFMREREEGDSEAAVETRQTSQRMAAMKEKMVPDFSFTLTPDARLLFQFSALSFNAHAIHLDRDYARRVEGHRDLLVHGPLSLSLMLMALRAHAGIPEPHSLERPCELELTKLTYRNLAPLYVDEPMKVCVRGSREDLPQSWDAWVEGPDGGFAVKGTAEVVKPPRPQPRTQARGSEIGVVSQT